jgi:hypothetical protein
MHPKTRNAIKTELKNLATDLKVTKTNLRIRMREETYKTDEQWHILKVKREYRHLHMAYCLLRGKTREEIEDKVKPGNIIDSKLVDEYSQDFKKMEEENYEKFPLPPSVKREERKPVTGGEGVC